MYKLIFLLLPILSIAQQYDDATLTRMREEQMTAIQTSKTLKIGKEMPNFETVDINGKSFSNKDLKGKVTVLNFWFKNCGPCNTEMPTLNKIVKKYVADSSIQFIAFSLDPVEVTTKYVAKVKFNYRHVANAKSWARAWDIKASPAHIVIDKEGKVGFFLIDMLESKSELIDIIEKLKKK
jgi:peroxiredoxin